MSKRVWRAITLLLIVLAPHTPEVIAREHPTTCAGYDAWIWAQAVYDTNPAKYAQLDPDGNGIACEDLSVYNFSPVIWADAIPSQVTPATVVGVTDGDTIRVRLADGTEDTVRLNHIDTPETGGTVGQCGGIESTNYLSFVLSLAENNTVYLETDVTERDRYDRRLAYVWFKVAGDPNPYMANDTMVLSGWAESQTYKPDDKYKAELDKSEQFSVEKVTGVRLLCGKFGQPANNAGPSAQQIRQAWNSQPNQGQLPPFPTAEQPIPPAQPTQPPVVVQPTPAPPPPVATSSECDPSYPDVCIPPAWQVGDLDCGHISFRRFRVVPPDSHGFDGDYDGIGCEGG